MRGIYIFFSYLQCWRYSNERVQIEKGVSNRNNYRKSKNDSECKPRIDSGMERNELWYMSNVSRNGNPVTSSGSSHKRFRDKSEMKKEKKSEIHHGKSHQYNGLQMRVAIKIVIWLSNRDASMVTHVCVFIDLYTY